ncbi:hypothetical protein RJ641_023303 [Dillenia turbinata]|uniref:Uncharacterized protein n=1 Tax=Dillenia turbinata TaxID=194707 RepID=A0AAN8U995_9MAGN
MASTAVSSGSMLPTANGPSVSIHSGLFNSDVRSLSNGYQQSASNFSCNSGRNNMMPSIGVQRITSQMIPTPGLNTSGNQSYMNRDSSNNGGCFPAVDSTMVSQSQQPKQPVGGQNSRILHNFGSQMILWLRKWVYKWGIWHVREQFTSATPYGNSYKPLQQHFDQQHSQQLIQGDGYGMSSSYLSGSGDVYGPITSAGSIVSKANPNQLNLHATQQAAHIKPHAIDQPGNMSFHPSHSMRENVLQSQQQQPFQQQAHQFQPPQFVQHQRHQKHQNQHHQLMLKNDSFGQAQLAPDLVNQVKTERGM